MDVDMHAGMEWAKTIDEKLQWADFLISFLSATAIKSKMVLGEIERAYGLADDDGRQGKPAIIPVLVRYKQKLPYPLTAYLSGVNWATWDDESQTQRLLQDLAKAVAGQEPAPRPPAAPAVPQGAGADPDAEVLIGRPDYGLVLDDIHLPGRTYTIKGPKQMGKSTLLDRAVEAAAGAGKQVAFIDLKLFNRSVLESADTFYEKFCRLVSHRLGVEDRVSEFWQQYSQTPLNDRADFYFRDHVIPGLTQPAVLAMEDVDRLFLTSFYEDFFALIRYWHEGRRRRGGEILKKLDLLLVTSTEPRYFIQDRSQSPFNVGRIVRLDDFQESELKDLNGLYGDPLTPAQLSELFKLVGGQPFLTQRAMEAMRHDRSLTPAKLVEAARRDAPPFGDHLRYHLFRLLDTPALLEAFRAVLLHKPLTDKRIIDRLIGTGLVRQTADERLEARYSLYADYYGKHVAGKT